MFWNVGCVLEFEVGIDISVEVVCFSLEEAEHSGKSDHGGVVGAERGICEDELDIFFCAAGFEGVAKGVVETYAAGECEDGDVFGVGGADAFLDKDIDDGGLE